METDKSKEIRKVFVTLEITFECDAQSETSDAINDALELAINSNFNSVVNGTRLIDVEETDIDDEW